MKPPFTLVADTISKDTQEALEQLLVMARRGDLIGVAFAAMLNQRKYFVNVAGEAYRNPGFSCSCIRVLDAELVDRMRGKPNGL